MPHQAKQTLTPNGPPRKLAGASFFAENNRVSTPNNIQSPPCFLRAAALLRERLDRPVDVVNAAMPGYSSTQMRMLLEDSGRRFQPDLVLPAGLGSDTMTLRWTDRDLLRRFSEEGYRYDPWWRRAGRFSALFQRAETVVESGKPIPRDKAISWTIMGNPNDPEAVLRRVSVEDQAENLRAMVTFSRRQGWDICLLLLPRDVDELRKYPEEGLRPYRENFPLVAREMNACLLDMRDVVDPQPVLRQEDSIFVDGSHLKPGGHERVARALAERIAKRVEATQ